MRALVRTTTTSELRQSHSGRKDSVDRSEVCKASVRPCDVLFGIGAPTARFRASLVERGSVPPLQGCLACVPSGVSPWPSDQELSPVPGVDIDNRASFYGLMDARD